MAGFGMSGRHSERCGQACKQWNQDSSHKGNFKSQCFLSSSRLPRGQSTRSEIGKSRRPRKAIPTQRTKKVGSIEFSMESSPAGISRLSAFLLSMMVGRSNALPGFSVRWRREQRVMRVRTTNDPATDPLTGTILLGFISTRGKSRFGLSSPLGHPALNAAMFVDPPAESLTKPRPLRASI